LINIQQLMKKILVLLLFVLASTACEQKKSLYEDIPTEVVSVIAHSHNELDYQPVPDSLQLRFNTLLRLLRVNVVSEGCGPNPEAKLTVEQDRLIIQFDLQSSCVHDDPEFFDVEINLSPVHPDVFQLIVEEKDFETSFPGRILLNRRVDVRELPRL